MLRMRDWILNAVARHTNVLLEVLEFGLENAQCLRDLTASFGGRCSPGGKRH